jgi:hypothetical protein
MMELDRKDPFGIEKLLHPTLSYSHPSGVLTDPELGVNEKRAAPRILGLGRMRDRGHARATGVQ